MLCFNVFVKNVMLWLFLIQGCDVFWNCNVITFFFFISRTRSIFLFFFEVLILCSFGGISMPGISFRNFHVVTIFCKFQSYDFFFKIQCLSLIPLIFFGGFQCYELFFLQFNAVNSLWKTFSKFLARTFIPNSLLELVFQIQHGLLFKF